MGLPPAGSIPRDGLGDALPVPGVEDPALRRDLSGLVGDPAGARSLRGRARRRRQRPQAAAPGPAAPAHAAPRPARRERAGPAPPRAPRGPRPRPPRGLLGAQQHKPDRRDPPPAEDAGGSDPLPLA